MKNYETLYRYTVYQLNIKEHNALINDKGWEEAARLRKEIHVHLETTLKGSVNWEPEWQDYFHKVCDIRATSLAGVFEAGNIGPEYLLDRFAPMHSISVGDLILAPTGRTYMVDREGFTEVSVDTDSGWGEAA